MAEDSHNSEEGRRTVGCFPLYPPLELIHSMGLDPVVLWGLPPGGTAEADRHVQNYVCSVGHRLAQHVMACSHGLAGIFHYNACDTLRNLPEIVRKAAGGEGRLPAVSMHLPAYACERPSWERALAASVERTVRELESAFGARFSEGRFRESADLYARLRAAIGRLALLARGGSLPFGEYAALALRASHVPPGDALGEAERALAREHLSPGACAGEPVIISGILPPPGDSLARMDGLGLRVVADDVAAMSRAHSHSPAYVPGSGPAAFYVDFYRGHAPCPTLLHTADARPAYLAGLVESSGAAGVVFVGEKFCEYEYFEYPYLQKELAWRGIPSLLLEFALDDAGLSASHVTRIQAFAELLAAKRERGGE